MRNGVPIGQSIRTTWRTDVREIAEALGIGLGPDQWVVLESADDDGSSEPLSGRVDLVVWKGIPLAQVLSEMESQP